MKIKSLHIDNFKSLIDFKLIEPNPFSVFVGANGVGKSNIFEALEFFNYKNFNSFNEVDSLFGGYENFVNANSYKKGLSIRIASNDGIDDLCLGLHISPYKDRNILPGNAVEGITKINTENVKNSALPFHNKFIKNFSRVFINSKEGNRVNLTSNKKLNFNCNNVADVLKRLLNEPLVGLEIKEWLQILRPGFSKIEIENDLSSKAVIQFYENGYDKPFGENLISDGTRNILCILTAIYQTKEPQFICIEEPENGLNPYVIKEMVTFFREQCRDKGHYIWLNTHSQTLVNQLNAEEIIVVNKEEGITKANQIKNKNLHGLALDEAWLTNTLGGGVPW